MSDLEKLFEALSHRSLTIRVADGRWHVETRFLGLDVVAEGETASLALHAALLAVLDRAQAQEREAEDYARKARDEAARLRAIVGDGK